MLFVPEYQTTYNAVKLSVLKQVCLAMLYGRYVW